MEKSSLDILINLFVCMFYKRNQVKPNDVTDWIMTELCSSLCMCFRFPVEIQSGLLEIISPSIHFYPDFSHLKESFGDPKERVR